MGQSERPRQQANRNVLAARAASVPEWSVECPHCGAEPGAYCNNPGGYTVATHKVRYARSRQARGL